MRDVASGRKYRLKTLGLIEDWERARVRWKRSPGRVRAVKVIERERLLHELRGFDFRKDIVEALSITVEDDDSERVQRAMKREVGEGAVMEKSQTQNSKLQINSKS